MAGFDSELAFEKELIETLYNERGWNSGKTLHYPTEQDLLDNWAEILYHNNRSIDRLGDYPLTRGEMAQIIEQIDGLKTPMNINGFVNGKSLAITRDNEDDKLHFGKEVSLEIYDRNQIANGSSVYQIAEQPRFNVPHHLMSPKRGDFMLLINGMPLFHVELKKSGVDVSQATSQIERYSRVGVFQRGIFSMVQVFIAMTPESMVYFANPGFDGVFDSKYYFHWMDINNEPINDWRLVAEKFMSIPAAHRIIGFYTVADKKDFKLKVMRSYQIHAARAIMDRVRKAEWDARDIYGGYIFHTTGSGKTLTSYKAAQLVSEAQSADKVVFLLDRIELGEQSLADYQKFADNPDDIQDTENTDALITKLKSGFGSDTLIVTSIQKMSRIKDNVQRKHDIDIIKKKHIAIIIDECHRSTFGDMLTDIKATFPRAIYFGFTGTPINEANERRGMTTNAIFGRELHRYSLADGIRDHNVLGFDTYMEPTYKDDDIRQAVALERAKSETVEEAMSDEDKKKVFLRYMNDVPMAGTIDALGNSIPGIENYIPSSQYNCPKHREKVVESIKGHWMVTSCANKFHAILATSSIPEAVAYYELLKEKMPELKATCVFDPTIDNDGDGYNKEMAVIKILEDYNKLFDTEFDEPHYASFKSDVACRLAHKEPYRGLQPKDQLNMVIVVYQMLTGYDSKWVNALYVDKKMEYEQLIQAFSRTNRLFEGYDKQCGMIYYYRYPHTMKRNVDEAVSLYSGKDAMRVFANKLGHNLRGMNECFELIEEAFRNEEIENFEHIPKDKENQKILAKNFHGLTQYYAAAKLQMFTWEKLEWDVDGEHIVVKIDEATYNTLLQRYKELFEGTGSGGGGEDIPYAIDTYLTQIAVGKYNADYMNGKFKKYIKAIQANDLSSEVVKNILDELHKTFASLPQEDQKFADMFYGDLQRGEVTLAEDKTIQDYISEYKKRESDSKIRNFADAFGISADELASIINLTTTGTEVYNMYNRFDNLMDTVDRAKAKQYIEERTGERILRRDLNAQIEKVLRRFILKGETFIQAEPMHSCIAEMPHGYGVPEDAAPLPIAAEDIFIPGSVEVRLKDTRREELLEGNLDLILMYAIGPAARQKTESAGRIALGIKEENLSPEAVKALEGVQHIMFHYWKNSEARPFTLTAPTRLVSKSDIPEGYLVRMDNGAKQYLLLEYDATAPAELGDFDILKAQRKGSDRYIPFVCKVENIK